MPTWTRSRITRGRGDLGDDVPARLGVDDDEVVVPLADLVGELADSQDLLDARRRIGDEVERAGERADAPDQRHLDEQCAGTRAASPRCSSPWRTGRGRPPRLERQRRGVERGGEGALGVHLAHERALAGAGAEVGERGGDGRLADATLAGDEQQAASSRSIADRPDVSRRSRCGGRRRWCRARCRRSWPPGRRRAGPACR